MTVFILFLRHGPNLGLRVDLYNTSPLKRHHISVPGELAAYFLDEQHPIDADRAKQAHEDPLLGIRASDDLIGLSYLSTNALGGSMIDFNLSQALLRNGRSEIRRARFTEAWIGLL